MKKKATKKSTPGKRQASRKKAAAKQLRIDGTTDEATAKLIELFEQLRDDTHTWKDANNRRKEAKMRLFDCMREEDVETFHHDGYVVEIKAGEPDVYFKLEDD